MIGVGAEAPRKAGYPLVAQMQAAPGPLNGNVAAACTWYSGSGMTATALSLIDCVVRSSSLISRTMSQLAGAKLLIREDGPQHSSTILHFLWEAAVGNAPGREPPPRAFGAPANSPSQHTFGTTDDRHGAEASMAGNRLVDYDVADNEQGLAA